MLAERQSRRVVFLMLALQLLSLVGLLAHSRSSVGAYAFPYPSWRRGLIHVQEQPCKVCSTPSTTGTATATTTTRLSLHRKLPDLFGKSDDDKKKLQSDNTRDRNDKDSSDPEESTSSSSSSGTRSKNTSSSSNNSNTRLSQNVGGVMESMGNFKNAQKVGQLTQNLVQDLSRTMSEGTAAEGRVRVVLDGQQRPVSVKIDASYFEVMLPSSGGGGASSTDDASLFAEELSSAITAAMQRAHAKSVESIDEKMKSLYNELGIPSSK